MRLFYIGIVVALLLGGGVGYRLFSGGMPPGMMGGPPGAMPVSVAPAIQKEVTVWTEFAGRLRAAEDVSVRPRVSGTIDKVHFTEGAFVKKGDPLFTIDLKPYRAAWNQAEGLLSAAKSRLALTRIERDRAAKLVQDRAISQSEFDKRDNAMREADAAVKAAAATLEAAALNLQYAQITSPIDGRVGRPEITVGNTVEAGPGAPVLTTIQSVHPIYADFEIDEQTYLKLLAGGANKSGNVPVYLALANERDFSRTGIVRSFDNQLNLASGTMRVRAEFDNRENLLTPGLFARVRLGSATPVRAVLVNDQAIGTDQNKKFVFVVKDDGTVEYRPVVPGPVADGLRIVESGLQPDENVVVNGLMRVRPGAKVVSQPVAMDTLQSLTPADAVPATGEAGR